MHAELKFSFEVVDGERFGKLAVPYTQVAKWINFLTSPHYGAQIIFAEQGTEGVTLYFDACEGMYQYLGDRVRKEAKASAIEPLQFAVAS